MELLFIRLGATLFGLTLGVWILSKVAIWAYVLSIAIRDWRVAAPATRPSVFVLTAPAVLHSGPWFGALGLAGTYYVFATPYRPEWLWFYQGVAAGAVVLAIIAIRGYLNEHRNVTHHHEP